jgi:hypothetical protein
MRLREVEEVLSFVGWVDVAMRVFVEEVGDLRRGGGLKWAKLSV